MRLDLLLDVKPELVFDFGLDPAPSSDPANVGDATGLRPDGSGRRNGSSPTLYTATGTPAVPTFCPTR